VCLTVRDLEISKTKSHRLEVKNKHDLLTILVNKLKYIHNDISHVFSIEYLVTC
jgi:hypothetical protein